MSSLPFSAIVLAAGRSTRMGRDKALLEIDGVPLWRRQRDVLAAAGATEIFLSARPEQSWVNGARAAFAGVVHDAMPDCGPLVGVTAGLERASHPLLAVLAIDLPRMKAAWFYELAALATENRGAVARRGSFFEPLAAIYPRAMKWLAWEALARGEYSLQRVLGDAEKSGLLCVREVDAEKAEWFANWNQRADL